MSVLSKVYHHPMTNTLKPFLRRFRIRFLAPFEARIAVLEATIQELQRNTQDLQRRTALDKHAEVSALAVVEPKLDISLLLHNCRSAFLRGMPPGAQTI